MIKTTDPKYPYKRNPLTFEDVALSASMHWCVSQECALRYLKGFSDPSEALSHLRENIHRSPDAFWESL